ncbi:uncharacterized protein [Procambarus clarkii]|uniref:uncharacterized protein n=1 Tax=Procambarus clarkii TaxID=6728 RepID=UPI003743D653
MFRLQTFRANPAGEIGTLSRAKRTELQTLAHEYQLEVPYQANKNDLHNLLLDYYLEQGKIDSETHETYYIADKTDLATLKLKLELAKIEREQQREALEQQERAAAIRRDEQEREAALRRDEQEREAALRREEHEREVALLRERERVQLETKQRELEIQREHDKQQATLALECRQREIALETSHFTQRQQATANLPVSFNISHASKLMPSFVEAEVDVFFTTFETLANQLSWPVDQWATLLRVHLTGRAAVTLSTLASENDYYTLKQAVLDAYLLSTESYRRKFRDHLKASTTTFLEFANTKRRYFMKWLEAAHVSTFTELVNLMLVEEFLRRVPPPVRLYLADKEETDYLKCAKSADTYSLIHRLTPEPSSSKKSWYSYEKVSPDQAGSQLYCKYCRLYGHTIDKCGKSQYKGTTDQQRPKPTPPKSGKPVMNVGVDVNDLSLFSNHLYTGTVSANGSNPEGRFKLKILRDTAALQSIILKSAVPNIVYTGETVFITDLTATTPYPLARVHLDCPYVNGEVQVAVREKPFPMPGVQLLLGNDLAEDLQPTNLIVMDKPQVCNSVPINPILEYVPAEVQESDEVSPPVLVTTRAQAARPQPADSTATAVPQDPQKLPPHLTKLEFRKLQREDLTLTPLFFQAETQPDSIPGFFLENDLLYRRYRPSKLKEEDDWANTEQLVIPTSLRPTILHLAHGAFSHYGFNKTYHGIRQDYYWPDFP